MTDQHMATIINDQPVADLRAWLEVQAREAGLPYLLAHAADGVIWGHFAGVLTLAGEVFPEVFVALRPATLQQARIFGPQGEVLLWRVAGGFRSSRMVDGPEKPENTLEEQHYLWGAGQVVDTDHPFTLMRDGQQGLLHAIPRRIGEHHYAALQVRHYLAYDAQDQAYIARSRLLDLIELPGGNR